MAKTGPLDEAELKMLHKMYKFDPETATDTFSRLLITIDHLEHQLTYGAADERT